MTPQDAQRGEAALVAWLNNTLGFKAMFVPEYAERRGTEVIIQAMDGTNGTLQQKQHAAAEALYKNISDAGYGTQVTPTQCAACAVVVINAVLKGRGAA